RVPSVTYRPVIIIVRTFPCRGGAVGIEVVIEGLTKSFGQRNVWHDVSLTLPAGEVSVMLGPSGTGKTVFLKSLVGLVKPERGRVLINGVDVVSCSER